VLERAAATLGASPWTGSGISTCRCSRRASRSRFCLAFVQAFSVFPWRAGRRSRGIDPRHLACRLRGGIRAYDYRWLSAVAMIMGFAQLAVVVAVLALRRGFLTGGPVAGGKG